MKLYAYRRSQNTTLIDAVQDGAIRYIGTFENKTQADLIRINEIKMICNIISEMCQDTDDIIFIEEDEERNYGA